MVKEAKKLVNNLKEAQSSDVPAKVCDCKKFAYFMIFPVCLSLFEFMLDSIADPRMTIHDLNSPYFNQCWIENSSDAELTTTGIIYLMCLVYNMYFMYICYEKRNQLKHTSEYTNSYMRFIDISIKLIVLYSIDLIFPILHAFMYSFQHKIEPNFLVFMYYYSNTLNGIINGIACYLVKKLIPKHNIKHGKIIKNVYKRSNLSSNKDLEELIYDDHDANIIDETEVVHFSKKSTINYTNNTVIYGLGSVTQRYDFCK